MNLKRKIAAGAATLLLIGSVMNVSATELSSSDYVDTLIKNKQESLILNVDAYKAAYSDLAKAFGNDREAYVNHYLTQGVYEGRTKGVLFDPLIYAGAYSDVRSAVGYDIAAIVDHYLTFGISEKRTQGTSHGYADIDAAEKAGVQSTNINRNVEAAANGISASGTSAGSSSRTDNGSGRSSGSNTSDSTVAADSTVSNSNTATADNNLNAGIAVSNISAASTSAASTSASSSNNSVSSSSSNNNVTAAASNSASSSGAGSSPASPVKDYDHTTSHYTNDGTLIRIEYYDANNHLFKYSSVVDYDGSTNSYTEHIYHHDDETNKEILDRTDTYENGSLTSSK